MSDDAFPTYTEAEGDDAASRLLIGHHRKAVPIVRSRGGRVVKWLGDGLMLTFPVPEAAVLACLELSESSPLPSTAISPSVAVRFSMRTTSRSLSVRS